MLQLHKWTEHQSKGSGDVTHTMFKLEDHLGPVAT